MTLDIALPQNVCIYTTISTYARRNTSAIDAIPIVYRGRRLSSLTVAICHYCNHRPSPSRIWCHVMIRFILVSIWDSAIRIDWRLAVLSRLFVISAVQIFANYFVLQLVDPYLWRLDFGLDVSISVDWSECEVIRGMDGIVQFKPWRYVWSTYPSFPPNVTSQLRQWQPYAFIDLIESSRWENNESVWDAKK